MAAAEELRDLAYDPWDVVVLGAGPAGAVAARQLALAGQRVLLVEKCGLPRSKVCGGCLGSAALAVLERIGLGQIPAQCGAVGLAAFELAAGGLQAALAIDRRMAVDRAAFDAALASEAARAGAVVLDQTGGRLPPFAGGGLRPIELERSGGRQTVHARVVVVATGLQGHAPLESRIVRRSRIGLGAILPSSGRWASDSAGALRMAWSRDGYVGVAPLAGGRLDVAAAVDPRALVAAGSPAALISSILDEAGFAPPPGLDAAPWRGTPLLTRRAVRVAAHRLLAIGDAARYVEPFTGEGIGWAMHSAVLAGELVAARLDRWDAAAQRQWQRLYRQALAPHHRYCYAMTRILRSAALRSAAVWTLSRAPALARPVIRHLEQPLRHPTPLTGGARGGPGAAPPALPLQRTPPAWKH
ncbi:MAG: FAD-dependent monooxygenase [Pirellulales bacterium]|nr:FAD-dependent monooxygenase [Pirellulales bacterium]